MTSLDDYKIQEFWGKIGSLYLITLSLNCLWSFKRRCQVDRWIYEHGVQGKDPACICKPSAYCCYLNSWHRTRSPRKLRFEFWSTSTFTGLGENEKELTENWPLHLAMWVYWNLNKGSFKGVVRVKAFFGVNSRENLMGRIEDGKYR